MLRKESFIEEKIVFRGFRGFYENDVIMYLLSGKIVVDCKRFSDLF